MTPTIRRINRGRGHSYKIDGKPAIGVTTALKALPKPALAYWSARLVAEFTAEHIDDLIVRMNSAGGRGPLVDYLKALPWQQRDTAAVKGTEVHAIAERIHGGEEFDVAEHLVGYVESYLQFLTEWTPTPLHTEFVVGSRNPLYAGTGDSIMKFPSLGTGLIDIKTSKGIYGDYALQMAAYRYAELMVVNGVEQPMIPVDFCAIVHVRPEGYDLVPIKADEQAYEAFTHAHWLYTHELKQDHKTKQSPMDERVGKPMGADTAVGS